MRLRASMSATEGWLAQRMIQHRRCHLRPCAGLTAALMVWDFPDRGGLPHGDRAMAGIYLWILRHHGLIRNPIMTSFYTARRSDRGQLLVGPGSTSVSDPKVCCLMPKGYDTRPLKHEKRDNRMSLLQNSPRLMILSLKKGDFRGI